MPARAEVGEVWLFDPSASEPVPEGARRLSWSPVSASSSWDDALIMARAMTAAARAGRHHEREPLVRARRRAPGTAALRRAFDRPSNRGRAALDIAPGSRPSPGDPRRQRDTDRGGCPGWRATSRRGRRGSGFWRSGFAEPGSRPSRRAARGAECLDAGGARALLPAHHLLSRQLRCRHDRPDLTFAPLAGFFFRHRRFSPYRFTYLSVLCLVSSFAGSSWALPVASVTGPSSHRERLCG